MNSDSKYHRMTETKQLKNIVWTFPISYLYVFIPSKTKPPLGTNYYVDQPEYTCGQRKTHGSRIPLIQVSQLATVASVKSWWMTCQRCKPSSYVFARVATKCIFHIRDKSSMYTIWLWLTVRHGKIHPFLSSVNHLFRLGPWLNHGELWMS